MNFRIVLISLLYLLTSGYNFVFGQNSMTKSYNGSDIPMIGSGFNPTCNGPSTTIKFTLPPGESINVTGFDVNYNIQSVGSNSAFAQRSAIHCQNTQVTENYYTGGPGASGTLFNYNRTNVDIANGTYAGGEEITFEMRAWYITIGPCDLSQYYVDGNSWSITLYYGDAFTTPFTGVNTETPKAVFDINGKLKLGNDNAPIETGNIRYNRSSRDFGIGQIIQAYMYKKKEIWEPIHRFEIPRITTGNLSMNVGFSGTSAFFSIASVEDFSAYGIYYTTPTTANPILFSDIMDIPPDLLDGDNVTDPDADPTNELISTLSLSGSILNINESGNSKFINLSSIASPWEVDGADIYFNNNIGIGIVDPQEALDMSGTIQVTKNSSSGDPHINLVETGADFVRLYMENSTTNIAVIAANPKTDTDESIINFFLDGAGDVMTIKGNDRVGINDTSPNSTLHVKHGDGQNQGIRLENTGSDWWNMAVSTGTSDLEIFSEINSTVPRGTFNYTSGAYTSASDKRLKKEISDLHFGWDTFMKIQPTNYIFKADSSNRKQLGLIAQDFKSIYPELVHHNEEQDSYKIDYTGTGVVAIKAIQELYKENLELKSELDLVKSQLLENQFKSQYKLQRLEQQLEAILIQVEKMN